MLLHYLGIADGNDLLAMVGSRTHYWNLLSSPMRILINDMCLVGLGYNEIIERFVSAVKENYSDFPPRISRLLTHGLDVIIDKSLHIDIEEVRTTVNEGNSMIREVYPAFIGLFPKEIDMITIGLIHISEVMLDYISMIHPDATDVTQISFSDYFSRLMNYEFMFDLDDSFVYSKQGDILDCFSRLGDFGLTVNALKGMYRNFEAYLRWLLPQRFIMKNDPFIVNTVSNHESGRRLFFVMNDYKLAQLIVGMMTEKVKGKKKYEMYNILSRWFISMAGRRTGDSIFIDDDELNEKMISELVEKGLKHKISFARQAIEMFSSIIIDVDTKRPMKFSLGGDVLTVEDHVFILDNFEMEMYNDDPENFVVNYLRYLTLAATKVDGSSLQWGVPMRRVKSYHEKYGVRNEAFASIFNSRLRWLEDGRYCSLFPETEAGSLGDFMALDMSSVPGGWLVNPPFIEEVMKASAEKVLDFYSGLGEETVHTFFYMPAWFDSECYELLSGSEFTVHKKFLKRGKHYYEAPGGARIKAQFNSFVFHLSN